MPRRTHDRLFFTFLLIASVALLVLVPAFHHHHDGHSHSDCSLCMAVGQPGAIDNLDTQPRPTARKETLQAKPERMRFSGGVCALISPRAPPR